MIESRHVACVPAILVSIAVLLACEPALAPAPPPVAAPPPQVLAPVAPIAPATPSHTGDLSEIREQGRLRILVLRVSEGYLPRRGSPLDQERKLAEALAKDLGLEAQWVRVDGLDELIPALLDGRGDLIVDNFTVTEPRRQRVAFSLPIEHVREQVVVRYDDETLRQPSDLAGRRLAVRRSSSFWETAEDLRQHVDGLEIEVVSEQLDTHALLDGVASGRYDATLADGNLVDAALNWRDDIRVAFDVGAPRLIAWALRPDAIELRKAVDGYLAEAHVGHRRLELHTDDLPTIEERGVLRVLTRNNPTTYFIWKGELLGFEYELAREFARRRGLRLEMVVPPSRDDLLSWLLEGKGDIVAAGLTASEEGAKRLGVAFSRPHLSATEMLIAKVDDASIARLEDLAGRTVVVRRSSHYWQTLETLQDQGIALEIQPAPEELETWAIIARVASGEYDLSVADSSILAVEQSWRSDIRGVFALGEPVRQGWALRPENPLLLAAIDEFFDAEYRSLFYNVTVDKYFRNPRRVRRHVANRAERAGEISRWDDLAREYGRRYGFDWRLLVAQMYQESRFEPSARSFAGAQGLLQVLPRTANQFGFSDLNDPETGIHAGVRYMSWLRDRFPKDLSSGDRTWLALAAYNAGYGHVRDAQRIAESRGLDPDRWFGNVEQAMLLKANPDVYPHTRFGYARGSEPVHYVQSIRDRYSAYVRVAAPQATADPSETDVATRQP